MTHTPHELHEEFPAEAANKHALKHSDGHFARLADDYHEVNRALHRTETRSEIVSPDAEAEMRHRWVWLKDEVRKVLMAGSPA